ncbi:MAG: 4Fe-4S binding protein [Thermoplasmata archaeon]|nr:4Fe-4S binding protein [Thermoplasmata archaeon]
MRLKSYRVTSQLIFLFLSILGVVGLTNTGLIYPYFFCTACPGHTAACPLWVLELGAIQLWTDPRSALIWFFYLLGFLGTLGFLVGRAFCGWACPLGFLQEIYGKIRKSITLDLPKVLGAMIFGVIFIGIPLGFPTTDPAFLIINGYLGLIGVVLLILGFFGLVLLYKNTILNIILLLVGIAITAGSLWTLDFPEFPAFIGLFITAVALVGFAYGSRQALKTGTSNFLKTIHLKPTRIKYIILLLIPITSFTFREMLFTDLDPIGGVVATIPTLLMDPSGWSAGTYFWPKMVFVIMFFIFILIISRAWCKYLCPIGALMAPTNKISITDIAINREKCVKCMKCNKACPMNIDVVNYNKSLECVRCGRCVDACKFDAAHFYIMDRKLK